MNEFSEWLWLPLSFTIYRNDQSWTSVLSAKEYNPDNLAFLSTKSFKIHSSRKLFRPEDQQSKFDGTGMSWAFQGCHWSCDSRCWIFCRCRACMTSFECNIFLNSMTSTLALFPDLNGQICSGELKYNMAFQMEYCIIFLVFLTFPKQERKVP